MLQSAMSFMPHRLCLPAAAALVVAIATANCGDDTMGAATPTSPGSVAPAAWADEFDGAAGSPPDSRKWAYDLGRNNGWGNNELETYTSDTRNAQLDGEGHLVIRAETAANGFTSARLKTRGLMTAHYGRLEARIRVPVGQGLWPAFWMLGDTFNGSNWPDCGEIDVMEHVGRAPFRVQSAVHGPGYSGGRAITATQTAADGRRVADDYHTFAVLWEPRSIVFAFDGAPYHTVTPASLPPGARWVFDQPFFVLLNLAVGGDFPGPPDSTTQFPQEMRVDYVRYTPLSVAPPARVR